MNSFTGLNIEKRNLTVSEFPICLFSDLHADLECLQQLIAETVARRYFCVGDFVDFRESLVRNYTVVALCQERGIRGVRGNHDDYVCAIDSVEGAGKRFLQNLPNAMVLQMPFGRIGLFHSSPSGNVAFFDAVEMKQFLPIFKELCLSHVFVGHTHTGYTIDLEGIHLTNLGHLGRVSVGDTHCSYCFLHMNGRLEHKRLVLK